LLLFDEADVFLEARSLTDVRRNSLVSTLLRILEYYEGILFLTSNRVKTFDEAFQSRIHFAVQFSILTEQQRKKIWEMWFKKAGDKLDPSFDWRDYLEEEGRLVKEKLNGRQIRNVFRSAMNLANADNEDLQWRHIDEILQRTVSFQNYMLQGEEMARKENLR
jgi:SpoVK/Ycf46/Vps4 family AAA+-type ATPase